MGTRPRLDQITPEMIEGFKTIRRNSITVRGVRLSPTSVNRELEILSKIFTKAEDFGKVDRNPCRQVERFKNRKVIPRYFTHDEEDRLMAAMVSTLAHLRPIAVVRKGGCFCFWWTKLFCRLKLSTHPRDYGCIVFRLVFRVHLALNFDELFLY